MANKRDMFLAYCTDYVWGKPRTKPLNQRTLGRYLRGLQLVEKLIGHNLEEISDNDQLVFIEKIAGYAQGTRRVSTQIFQRYIAWGIKNKYLDCNNLINGREDLIIGPNTKPTYKYIPKTRVNAFFRKLKTPSFRILFGLIYYGGLTTTEVALVGKDNITDTGVFVYREVRRESQMLPLPPRFMTELREYAKTTDSSLLGLSDNTQSRFEISTRYKAATIESGELIGTSVRDLRTSGIRHFFELSHDLELTKEFAGVPDKKKGWLEDLLDVSSHYMRTIAKARSYHGSTNETMGTE